MAKSGRGRKAGRTGSSKSGTEGLFTAAERRLLSLSSETALAKASPADIRSTLALTRAAREKWRSLSVGQDRGAKRSPRAVAKPNARSHDKAEILADAVKRLEARLAQGAPVGDGATAVAGARGRKVSKKLRVAGNRTARAGVRSTLSHKVAALNEAATERAAPATGGAAKKDAVTKPAAKHAATKDVAAVKSSRVGPAAKKGKRRSPATATQAVSFDGAKQRSLRSAAKNARLMAAGLVTRRASHAVASVKRSQARRDKRR